MHGRGQKSFYRLLEGAQTAQVGERHLQEVMDSDHDAGPARYRHDREQPGTVRKPQIQLGRGSVKAVLGAAEARRSQPNDVNELLVGVGDRVDLPPCPVAAAHVHRIAAVDVNVGEVSVLQEALQATETEQRVEDRLGELVLNVVVEGRPTVIQSATAVFGQRSAISRRANWRSSSTAKRARPAASSGATAR